MSNAKIRTHADQLFTDKGAVRLSKLSPRATITINGRTVRVRDIPLNRVKFECGHITTGIAITDGDMLYCETCNTERTVVLSRQALT